jgi:hypothetical protein
MGTGAVAANFHEGSRSEYLAHYVFASFGTATAVAHQEDVGIDLYCTLTERVGQLAWARAYFSVQVKSDDRPWQFEGVDSVRWLLEHPTPLFLCVVNKKELRLRVFQTCPRLLAAHAPHPTQVTLEPGEAADRAGLDWTAPGAYSLGPPIIDYTMSEFLEDEKASNARACLRAWADIDAENIRRRASGMAAVEMPADYRTNEVPHSVPREGGGSVTVGGPDEAAIPRLIELLGYIGLHNKTLNTEMTAVLINLLHRHLTRDQPRRGVIPFVDEWMNKRMKMNAERPQAPYLFAAVDKLLDMIRDAIGEVREP